MNPRCKMCGHEESDLVLDGGGETHGPIVAGKCWQCRFGLAYLHPNPEMRRRIKSGHAAVKAVQPSKAERNADPQSALIDTLANVIHWAHSSNLNIESAWRVAKGHVQTEAAGEEDEA